MVRYRTFFEGGANATSLEMRAEEVRGVLNDYYFFVSCIICSEQLKELKCHFTEEGKIGGGRRESEICG